MVKLPETCKVAALEVYGEPLQLREIPLPAVEPKGILVKVEMAGLCGTDVHSQRGELTIKPPLPIIPGHETIGRIVELGTGRDKDVAGEQLKVGDRIMWAHIDCGECYGCEIARDSVQCVKRGYYGYFPLEALMGGFAEYAYVTPVTKVVRVPDDLSDEEAVGVGCAFRTVVGAFERFGGIRFQENIVIQGSGPVGLYATVMAAESGAGRIIVVGAPANRLALALKWGATDVISIDEMKSAADRKNRILELTEGRGPEVVVECSGVPMAFSEGLDMIQKGGRYLVVGQTSAHTIPVAPGLVTGKGLQIIGASGASIPHYYKALQFISKMKNKYPFGDIVTHKFALEDIMKAYEVMASGEAIKPVIDNTNR
jgi:L-iditol 2-dehydrogenase